MPNALEDFYRPCNEVGGMSLYGWDDDPKRIGFMLARYKFAAKMLSGKRVVCEVGCGDGMGSRIVAQHVQRVCAVDLDAEAIEIAKRTSSPKWPVEFRQHDILKSPVWGEFDAVYSLDVFEHIEDEDTYLENLSITARVAVIGTPSLESQIYASPLSKAGHVNCKSGEALRASLKKHWREVFIFGMNDETLHTGYLPMSHYLLAVCVL